MAKTKKTKFDPLWAKANKVCRLNMGDIQMAKALGLAPRTLMKNNPSPSQRWKAPVKYWIRELYEKRFRAKPELPRKPSQPDPHTAGTEPGAVDDNIPF